MRRFLHCRYVGVVCLLAAAVLGVAAVADHRNKQARIDRAELAEWYCAHAGTRCGGASSAEIERHWNERQLAYEWSIIALGGLGTLRVAAPGILRRRVR